MKASHAALAFRRSPLILKTVLSALKRGGQAEGGTGAEALGQPIHGKRASRVASSALLQRAELDPFADGMRCRNVGEAGVREIPHENRSPYREARHGDHRRRQFEGRMRNAVSAHLGQKRLLRRRQARRRIVAARGRSNGGCLHLRAGLPRTPLAIRRFADWGCIDPLHELFSQSCGA
ncbi:hypothetical protein C1W90_31685 [Burkholderia pseudomallei]|uniref:Uncharacterized protein n=1 Tax=Burkholderia pseudomallei TaxID=28450 RepID=A0AAX0U7H0_BURPE|nr:hypothetical protein BHT10_26475 [Burkholderia pseudomallei]MPT65454.1 hypothetical protein [Burkholderia pseudomallei]MPT72503.1 hypothetical protein [Burkholderia pseudomallei]MPT80171.1 hypothetical protein [Burkholderia pseudomallei]MPT84319.1 hypothetical protein [Burkholderia pseudomallei]